MAPDSRSPAADDTPDARRDTGVRDTALVLHPCLVPADARSARQAAGSAVQRAALPEADGAELRRGRRGSRSEALWRYDGAWPQLLMWLPGNDRRWRGSAEASLSSDAACAVWCSPGEFTENAEQYLRDWCGLDDVAAATAAAAATRWLWPGRSDTADDRESKEDRQ